MSSIMRIILDIIFIIMISIINISRININFTLNTIIIIMFVISNYYSSKINNTVLILAITQILSPTIDIVATIAYLKT